jgi:hypothetical protein
MFMVHDDISLTGPVRDETMIGLAGATFSWSSDTDIGGTVTPSKRAFRLNIQNELTFKRECINMIVGPTGSGKTSILLALLGMIRSDCISCYSCTLKVKCISSLKHLIPGITSRDNTVLPMLRKRHGF